MKRYINLILSIVKINLIKAMTYRANFILNIVDSVVWFIITLIFFNSLYQYLTDVNGWNIYDIYLLIGTSELLKSLLFTLFINNLPYIPRLVNRAELDLILIKPVNSQFMVSLRNIDLGNLGNIVPAIFLIAYALMHQEESILVASIFMYLLLMFTGVILAYSLWFTTMTLSIWLTNIQGMHELFLGAMTLIRYPASLYKGLSRFIFLLVFPVILVSNVPVNALLNMSESISINIFIMYTVGYFCFSVFFWRLALRYYRSASS